MLNTEKLRVLLIGQGEKLLAREKKLRELGVEQLSVIRYPSSDTPLPEGGKYLFIPLPEGGDGGGFTSRPGNHQLVQRAKSARKTPTGPEKKLWDKIKAKQLGNHKFRRQEPIGRYIADFTCYEKKLIIEIDGDTHANSAEYDKRRTQELNNLGFKVIRFSNREILENIEGVLLAILTTLNNPPPSPPSGRGDSKASSLREEVGGGSIFPSEYHIVLIVGLDDATSAQLHAEAKAAGALVNVEDKKEFCDFFFQSFVKRGELLLSVSTKGQSPGTAKIIRDKLGELFPEIWGERIDEIAKKRAEWKSAGKSYDEVNELTKEYIKKNNWLV